MKRISYLRSRVSGKPSCTVLKTSRGGDISAEFIWDNFEVSVVTGNPISFDTNIASVVVPQRKFVEIVESVALGNMELQEGRSVNRNARALRGAQLCAAASTESLRESMGPKMSMSNYADFGLEAAPAGAAPEPLGVAEIDGVDSKEVGDFSVFTCKTPITILARKSAVVPMFNVSLNTAGMVLCYRESNHARRPYRAVKFRNETEWTLGKGKTIIYKDGVFSGECVLETTKPGDNRMLPHCLENGVKIVKEPTYAPDGIEQELRSIMIEDGLAVEEHVNTSVTTYTITNKKDESFKMLVEHRNILPMTAAVDFEGVEVAETEEISTGWRVYFDLASKQQVTLIVRETHVQQSKINLWHDQSYVQRVIVNPQNPLVADDQIKKCLDIQAKMVSVQESINMLDNQRNELNEQVERVRQNLSATKDVSAAAETVKKWVIDLDTSEVEIRQIEREKLPELREEARKLREVLREEQKKIKAAWESKAATVE